MKIGTLNLPEGTIFELSVASEPSNRATALATSTTLREIPKVFYNSGTSSLKVLDENYKFVYTGVVFKKESPLLEVFNEMVAKMEPNGLMEYWRRCLSYPATIIEEIGLQVLTMDHLTLGFLACCIPLALAVVVLLCELAWSKCIAACGKSSNDPNFEYNIESTFEIEDFDSKAEKPEEEDAMIKISNVDKTLTSRKSLEDSNEHLVGPTFLIEEDIDEIAIEMYDVDKATTSRKSLEDSNEPQVEETFQIEEKIDEILTEINNFDETATCSQREPHVKFVEDAKISIEECCVNNVAEGERDEIDDLIDQINFKNYIEDNHIV